MLTCAFSGAVGAFGLYLLSACARRTPHRRSSFFAVASLTFPRAAVFFDAAIAIKCFGVSIRFVLSRVRREMRADKVDSYLIIIKSLLPNVVASLYHDLTSPDTNPPAWALSGHVWISLVMTVLVPLSFLRRLDSLRHTSYIALFSCGKYPSIHHAVRYDLLTCFPPAYLVLIVIVCYFRPIKGMMPPGEIHFVKFTPSFVSTFPIQVFAFTCAQNVTSIFFTRMIQLLYLTDGQLFPIFNELKTNSQERMNIVIGTAIGSATVTYEIIAVFGYLTFGSHVRTLFIIDDFLFKYLSQVSANVIAMYPSTSLFIAVGQLAIAILVLFSYPLQVQPCRNCLDKVFHFSSAGEKVEDEAVEDEHGTGDMTPLKHTLLTAVVVTGGFMVAYFVDNLEMGVSTSFLLCNPAS
jgi:amino acid permease